LFARNHVVTVHDLFVFEHPEWYSRRYVLTHRAVQWFQMRTATVLVAVSEPTAERLRAIVGQRCMIVVAPNAPSPSLEQADHDLTARVMATHNLSEGRFFLAVGSADPRKNLSRIAEAHSGSGLAAELPLVVVGSQAGIFRSAPQGIEREVRRLGYVDDATLSALYAAAAAVVFVPLAEGFGLPAVEALAGEAQLICSDIAVLRWVCRDDATYVDPMDIGAIAAAMREVLASPRSAAAVAAAATRARARFSWTSSAAVVLDAIEARQR
jgi:glycosyltransferase involved in cell wall biosynthesis